ncbi:MAG: DUF4342 domain-containing protein [Bacteroidota bacterium]
MSSRPSFQDVQDEAARLAETAKDKAADAVEEIKVASNQIVDKVRELIEEGNVRRISIQKGDRTLFEIPLTVGAGVGAAAILLNPMLAAVGAAAALVADVTLVVERETDTEEEHVQNVNAPEPSDDGTPEAADDTDDEEPEASSKTMGRPTDDA